MPVAHRPLAAMIVIGMLPVLIACGPTTPAAVPATPTPERPVAPALAACDEDLQSRAMRPTQMPDWDTLAVSACYDLTLNLNPEQRSYTGQARVTFTNRTGVDLPDIVFRTYPNAPALYGGALEVTSAAVDGVAATPEVFLADRTAVRLVLPHPLNDSATTNIELSFEGKIPEDFGTGHVYGIFNYSTGEPFIMLADWYPLLATRQGVQWAASPVLPEGDAVVSDAALYRVQVTAPDGWAIVTTGTQVDTARQGAAVVQVFASGPVREFTVAASPAFESREVVRGGVLVTHWGLPGGEANWEAALEVAAGTIEVLGDRFGAYPYAELDVIAGPMRNASGVEYPGLVMINAGLYSSGQSTTVLPVTVAHEVGHHWWYGVIGSDVLAAPWQDEALTSFSSFLYFEETSPVFYQGVLEFYRLSVEEYARAHVDEPIAQPLSAFEGRRGAYGAIVYVKGAMFFAALREQIGDDAFFDALQTYYADFRYAIAPPNTLLAAFETACACDLEDLYRKWGATGP